MENSAPPPERIIFERLPERAKEAAKPCPPAHRTAYAYLLSHAHMDAIYNLQGNVAADSPAEVNQWRMAGYFQSTITSTLLDTPALDPDRMADLADAMAGYFPDCERFAERLRVLALLRRMPEEITEDTDNLA